MGNGERVEGQLQGTVEVGLEYVESLDNLLAATRIHVRMISTATDEYRDRETTEAKVAQVVSVVGGVSY
jgi:hypothetical protein